MTIAGAHAYVSTHGQDGKECCLGSPASIWADVVQKSPNKPRGHLNLAREYQFDGHILRATKEYQEAMRLSADRLNQNHEDLVSRDMLVSAQSNLGALMMKDDPEKAELALRGALSLMPYFGPASINLSRLLIITNRPTEAITVIDDALIHRNFGAGFTGAGKLYQNKGVALSLLGDCHNANLNFDKAASVDPDMERLECSTKGKL